ncbi:MAG: YfiR family protein [Myxococcales bacterium]|nr:YfiR family protein [Myxococcales bacterium]
MTATSRWRAPDGNAARVVGVLLVWLSWTQGSAPAQQREASASEGRKTQTEAKVKVAYVFNFFKFIEWPETEGETGGPLRICVVGRDEVCALLEDLAGRKVKGRTIDVARIEDGRSFIACHVLYLGRQEGERLETILQEIEGKPVLTVSDMPRFVQQGGMIGFDLNENRVKIVIRPKYLRRAGLIARAKLLEVATVVP